MRPLFMHAWTTKAAERERERERERETERERGREEQIV